jgi:hypothetical protein
MVGGGLETDRQRVDVTKTECTYGDGVGAYHRMKLRISLAQ